MPIIKEGYIYYVHSAYATYNEDAYAISYWYSSSQLESKRINNLSLRLFFYVCLSEYLHTRTSLICII